MNEVALIQLTGLNLTELNWVYERCREPLLSLRLSMRQRHENIIPWSSHNMLCVTIHWFRKYPSFDDLVAFFHQTRRYLVDVLKAVVHIMYIRIYAKQIRPLTHTSLISTRSTLPNVKNVARHYLHPSSQDLLPSNLPPQEKPHEDSVEVRGRV